MNDSDTDADACREWSVTLHGFVDGEIDALHSLRFEAHLADCPRCRAEVERIAIVRRTIGQEGVSWRLPDHVRAQVLDAVARMGRAGAARPFRSDPLRVLRFVKEWSFIPSMAALAASLVLFLAPLREDAGIDQQIVASHVRSLLVDHLTDVQTSDRHTVKPWFAGKVNFAPPVENLAADGFPMVGGRIDYLGGRVIPVVVYRRRQHVINLFMWPAAELPAPERRQDGYNLVSWTERGLRFVAVSDVSADDLETFRNRLSRSLSEGSP